MHRVQASHTASSRRPSPQAGTAAGLALVLYVVAIGLVRLFDYSAQVAQLEQLRQQGQLVPGACGDCAGLGAQVLSWMSDWRTLLLFALLLAVAVAGGLVARRTTGPPDRAGSGWPAAT